MSRVNPAPSLPLAEATIRLKPGTVRALLRGRLPKGNALAAARAAAVRAARSAGALLPLAGPEPARLLEVEFEVGEASITITASAAGPDTERSGSGEQALAAVGAAALAIYDVCKSVDREMTIGGVRLRLAQAPAAARTPAARGARARAVPRRRTPACPRCGVIVLSDSTARGEREDRSGRLLRDGLLAAGGRVDHFAILPDEAPRLRRTLRAWVREGVELVLTSGGTGLGPRDITVAAVEPLLDARLPGIEQALHAHGRAQVKTAMLSRLVAGTMGKTLVICLPGSAGAARDALAVLVPDVFHAFDMLAGRGHD